MILSRVLTNHAILLRLSVKSLPFAENFYGTKPGKETPPSHKDRIQPYSWNDSIHRLGLVGGSIPLGLNSYPTLCRLDGYE